MAGKPFGIDVSRWQGSINWDAVAVNERKVLFSGIRATISWGYVDSWFNRNWAESKRVGIVRAAYHILYPGVSPKSQMDNFLKVVGDEFGELPLVLDIELSHNKSPQEITNSILQCSAIIETQTGKKPILYSRASFIDQYVTGTHAPGAWLNQYDWWLAHYLRSGEEHAGPPALPKGVSRNRVILHQTSPAGESFGVQSKVLDYNRWQFDLTHFKNYIKSTKTLTLAEKIELLWDAHPELHP